MGKIDILSSKNDLEFLSSLKNPHSYPENKFLFIENFFDKKRVKNDTLRDKRQTIPETIMIVKKFIVVSSKNINKIIPISYA